MKKIITKKESETFKLAEKLAEKIKTGKVFALSGNLGAGKTVFTKGFVKGLGSNTRVVSPTFVLMKIYKIKKHPVVKNICHIDAYRLNTKNDLEAIGALEYFKRKDTVTLIEWPNKIKKYLPRETKFIAIKHKGEDMREIEIK